MMHTDAMSGRFAGQVALVTGGGSGIGRATARALAAQGATVVVAGRRADALTDTVRLIADGGGKADAVPTDVTRPADVAGLVATAVDRHGRLHVAVNAAGTVAAGPVADLDDDAWQDLVAVNLTGVFLCLKYEIQHMRAHGGGAIVNLSSTIGPHRRIPAVGGYGATKAAVSALTRAAALESIGDGVRINAVSPGPVDTPMSLWPGETPADRAERLKTALPIGRVGTLDEITSAVLWLASADGGFAVGTDLVVDGGSAA